MDNIFHRPEQIMLPLTISPPNSYQPTVSPPPIITNPGIVYVNEPVSHGMFYSDKVLGPPPGATTQMYMQPGGLSPPSGLSPTSVGPPTHMYPSPPTGPQQHLTNHLPPITSIPIQQTTAPTIQHHQMHQQPQAPTLGHLGSSSAVPVSGPGGIEFAPSQVTRMFRALRALEVVQRCAFMLDEESKTYRSQYEMYTQQLRKPAERDQIYNDMKQTLINLTYYYQDMKQNLQARRELQLNQAEDSIFTKFDQYFAQFEQTQMNLVLQGAEYLRENSGLAAKYFPPHERTSQYAALRRQMQNQIGSGSAGSHHSGQRSGSGGARDTQTNRDVSAQAPVVNPIIQPSQDSELSNQIQRILNVGVALQAHVEQQGARIKKQIEQALRCDTHKRFNDVSLYLYGACRQELLLRGDSIDFALHLPYPWKKKEIASLPPPSHQNDIEGSDSTSSRSPSPSIDSTSGFPPVPIGKTAWSASGSVDQKTMNNSPGKSVAMMSTSVDERKELEARDLVSSAKTKEVLDDILADENLKGGFGGLKVRKPPIVNTSVTQPSPYGSDTKTTPTMMNTPSAEIMTRARQMMGDTRDIDETSEETTPSIEPNLQYDESAGADDDMLVAIEKCLHNFQIDSEFHRIFSREKEGCVTFNDHRSMFDVKIRPYTLAHIQSTRLVTTFVQIDTRVRKLIIVCKYWAKQRKLNDRIHGFSTFALCCMVIHYLQCTKPLVLPVLPVSQQSSNWDMADCVKTSATYRRSLGKNTQSDGDLLVGFFKYFAQDFMYDQHVVSIRLGPVLRNSNRAYDWALEDGFVIEDPFDIRKNVAGEMTENDLDLLKQEMEVAYNVLVNSQQIHEICRVAT